MRPLALLFVSSTALAAPLAASSGPSRSTTLELFTSEGCSSCPPAERWLHENDRTLAAWRVIPLAFHVDYWDEIGWPDPFSSKQWTARQQRVAAGGRIYTPELALSGHEIRHGELEERAAALRGNAPILTLTVEPHAASLTITSTLVGAPSGAHVYYAVYENDLHVDIKRGENAGLSLLHDRVVRVLAGPGPSAEIALAPSWKREHLGVVAFVEAPGSTDVLQAVELPLRAR